MGASEALMEAIRSRRSVRRFQERPVPRALLMQVLEAARWAPSNHNRQGWRFVVLSDRDVLARLTDEVDAAFFARMARTDLAAAVDAEAMAAHFTAFRRAPAVVVVMYRAPAAVSTAFLEGVEEAGAVSGELISAAMATQNLLLACHACGLGACVMTGPLIAREAVERAANAPPGHRAACLVALGFPAEQPAPPRRKPLEQIVQFEGALDD